MRTRDHISEDHDHPLQVNYDPTTVDGYALREETLLAPDPNPDLERIRAAWAPRIVDPRTITTSRTA